MTKNQFILGFDYGTKTIGVSVGQTVTLTAQALPAIKARDGQPNWQDIATLIEEWQVTLAIVGLPINMDDSESELSQRARKFAKRLHGRFGIQVEMADERLSSFAARGEIIETTGSRDFKANDVDSLSARIILESWLQQQAQQQ